MRLGLYPARIEEGHKVRDAYGTEIAYERHRHRFEVNNAYRERLDAAGMRFSGVSPDGRLVEYIELRDHPWFVATQAHPELKSRPNRPHPLFRDFVGAAAGITGTQRPAPSRRRALGDAGDHRRDERALRHDAAPGFPPSAGTLAPDRRIADAARAHDRRLARGGPALPVLPERIARTDDRDARATRPYAAYGRRSSARTRSRGAPGRVAGGRRRAWVGRSGGVRSGRALAAGSRAAVVNIETPYFAALRRYLALIEIEQGDAAEADLWYVSAAAAGRSGSARATSSRARGPSARGARRPTPSTDGELSEPELAANGATSDRAPRWSPSAYRVTWSAPGVAAASSAWRSDRCAPRSSTSRLRAPLRIVRRCAACSPTSSASSRRRTPRSQRAYYSGIVGHVDRRGDRGGGYLAGRNAVRIGERPARPPSGRACSSSRSRAARDALVGDPRGVGGSSSGSAPRRPQADVLAELGYDALDWRPVLRQIRTRLIGEMSGYGGPNITTRAGTRKV